MRPGRLTRLALVLTGLGAMSAMAHAGSAIGVIAFEPKSGSVTITGRAVAVADGHYDVAMSVRKAGKSGTTNTTQRGTFDLAAGQSADVARLGVSFGRGDTLTVELEVSQAGTVISQITSRTKSP